MPLVHGTEMDQELLFGNILVQGMAQALAPVGSAYETLQRGTAQDLFSGLMSGILGDLWSPTPKKKKK